MAEPDPAVPMTFDAFKEMAKKLTKVNGSGKVTQYALHPGSLNFWESLIAMRGGSMYDTFVSPTKVTVNSPQGIAGLADYASLFTDKIVPPIDEQRENQWLNGDLDSLRTGKVAMARVGPWNFSDIAAKSPNIGVFPLPKVGDSLVLLLRRQRVRDLRREQAPEGGLGVPQVDAQDRQPGRVREVQRRAGRRRGARSCRTSSPRRSSARPCWPPCRPSAPVC